MRWALQDRVAQELTHLTQGESRRASIVVPVRNRPDLLARTLETLLAQDVPSSEFEIVICDDGSTDDIQSVAARFASEPTRVCLERQPQLGPAAARNLGVRCSNAPIVIFIDSDVIVDCSAVRRLIEALDSHPDWQGAEAALHPMGGEKSILWDAPSSTEGGHYHTAAIAYRRDVLLAVGGFDEQFRLPACEDVELALRVLRHGPIGFAPEAKVWHPRRRVTYTTHWQWRLHWRYETVLALRYGVLSFPENPCGPFPRLRMMRAALVGMPCGRFIQALKAISRNPGDAFLALMYSLFDVVFGLWALPSILLAPLPIRQNYLSNHYRPSGIQAALAINEGKRFAVVVAAHRDYDTLETCLRGFQALVEQPADLIFVDNGSGGTLTDYAKRTIPGATVVTLDTNRLFCGGYNSGIRAAMQANYDHVLIVNADTEVINPDFVKTLMEAMDLNPRVAFAGPLVYYRDMDTVQTTCLLFPRLLRSLLVWLPFRLLPRLVSRQSNQEHEVEFLNGVCVLCRVKALDEIGLMDESFEAYVEDADWAWRGHRLNWHSLFAPVPSIIHHEERHGYEHYSFKSFLLKRNTVRWFLKAGRPLAAWGYAKSSLFLAHLRTLIASNPKDREAYRVFAIRLSDAYRQLLSGKAFGPHCAAEPTATQTPATSPQRQD